MVALFYQVYVISDIEEADDGDGIAMETVSSVRQPVIICLILCHCLTAGRLVIVFGQACS